MHIPVRVGMRSMDASTGLKNLRQAVQRLEASPQCLVPSKTALSIDGCFHIWKIAVGQPSKALRNVPVGLLSPFIHPSAVMGVTGIKSTTPPYVGQPLGFCCFPGHCPMAGWYKKAPQLCHECSTQPFLPLLLYSWPL